jgi:hypothetical protein
VQVVLCKRTIRSAGESGPLEMLGWLIQRFAKPRIVAWRRRHAEKKRDQFFVTSNDVKLRQFVRRFSEFISAQNSHSLISMIRSGFSLNMPVEQIITGDYINNWFQSYCEQLAFPVTTRKQFLARSRELGNLIQQFNSCYAIRTQKHLALAPTSPPEQTLDQLETFREEYIAFLREFELWAKEIAAYLQSFGRHHISPHSSRRRSNWRSKKQRIGTVIQKKRPVLRSQERFFCKPVPINNFQNHIFLNVHFAKGSKPWTLPPNSMTALHGRSSEWKIWNESVKTCSRRRGRTENWGDSVVWLRK